MQIDGKYFTKDGLTESDGMGREALEYLNFDRYLLKNKDKVKLLYESEFLKVTRGWGCHYHCFLHLVQEEFLEG
jgi:hypothetical protein